MSVIINRRKFFKDTSVSAAGAFLGSTIMACTSSSTTGRKSEISSYIIMKNVMNYRKFDSHSHVWSVPDGAHGVIDIADRLGIEWLQISKPNGSDLGGVKGPETAGQMRELNNVIYEAMKLYPNRFIGFFTLNPLLPKDVCLDEIKRCTDLGFRGYKGYLREKVNHPSHFPIIEKLIDQKMICYMHAECQMGSGGYRMKYDMKEEFRYKATIPEDMVDVATRYPEGIFHWAHIGYGGDWEYMCKSFKNHPNIYVDTSGSNNAERMVDFAVSMLGEDRVFFGTDGSFYQGVGKILAANLTDAQKKKIFFDNYNNVLRKGGYHVS
ncbi:MAG: amidohydrolase family protein [Prolixibacteraceae bacterium]|nr:amidohydrolase family protein [Prolixibacteraceae bacterium]